MHGIIFCTRRLVIVTAAARQAIGSLAVSLRRVL